MGRQRSARARRLLIISILMFVRKKTKLGIAYALLTFTALALIASDAHFRHTPPVSDSQPGRAVSPAAALPLAITPLAESPFPEARPNRADANTALARIESTPTPREKTAAPSSVYFLTVAVQVNSNDGPVALIRGTRVLLVRQQGGKFLVRHNRTDFLIEKSQVTNDLNALAALARSSS